MAQKVFFLFCIFFEEAHVEILIGKRMYIVLSVYRKYIVKILRGFPQTTASIVRSKTIGRRKERGT